MSSFPSPNIDLVTSAIASWATTLHGLLLELEVRWSGESLPQPTFTDAELKLQSPAQNIDDIISFQNSFNEMYPQYASLPWILIGEYYNANYAIWARELYPEYFLGSVAVAGPVLAQSDFPNYFEYWATIAGVDCSEIIHTANLETEIAISGYPTEDDMIKSLFSCSEIEDTTQFFYALGQIVQFGIANYRNTFCDALLSTEGAVPLVEQYGAAVTKLLTTR